MDKNRRQDTSLLLKGLYQLLLHRRPMGHRVHTKAATANRHLATVARLVRQRRATINQAMAKLPQAVVTNLATVDHRRLVVGRQPNVAAARD